MSVNKDHKIIYPKGSRPSILHGRPKFISQFLKNNRPILPPIRTLTYKLAEILFPILSPLTVNEFSSHESFAD